MRSAKKTAETTELSVGRLAHVDPKEPCIRWGQDRTNTFAAVMMRLFAKLLWTLVTASIIDFGSM